MFFILALMSLVATFSEAKSIPSCPDEWTQLDDHCYYKSRREMDFYSAERFCRVRLASHLPILKDEKVAKLYYNLLLFHSSPYDTWLGAIPLKQLNNSWKWLDGSDILHEDMKQRFLVDMDWGFSEDEPNITPNTTYKDAINSIAAYHYLENLHCTHLILLQDSESGDHTPRFDFTRCDKSSQFYCQKRAEVIISRSSNRTLTANYQSSAFLTLTVIALTMIVLFLLIFGFLSSKSLEVNSEATAFYSNQ